MRKRTAYRRAPATLTVRVLAYDVPVVLTTRLASDRGEPAYGICEWDNRRILLSADTPRHLRLNVLCHEVWHAHRFELGRPDGIEAECDLFAMAAEAVVNAIAAAGGVDALLDMKPADVDADEKGVARA